MEADKINFKPHSEALNEAIFEAKNLQGVKPITLHGWLKSGVIEDKRDPEALRKWNYFSPIDIVWIGIVNELKLLRFKHSEMKECKEVLFEMITAEDGNSYPALEYYTFCVLLYNQPIYIVITYDKAIDTIWMLDENDYFLKLRSGEIENHTALLLHKVVKLNLDPIYDTVEFSKLAGLTDDELKVLEIIRAKEYKTIRILKRNGKVERVESTERIVDAERIEKMLRNGDYQNIEVKQNHNKITVAHRLVRTDFKR